MEQIQLTSAERAIIQEMFDNKEAEANRQEVKAEIVRDMVRYNIQQVIERITENGEPIEYENTADFYNTITGAGSWLRDISQPQYIKLMEEYIDELYRLDEEDNKQQ